MHFFKGPEKEPESEELFKKYFSFLVEQYGFTYTPYCYTSGKLKIILGIGHVSPRISMAYIGEPDFTILIFERIIQYFGGRVPDIYYPDHSIEYNIRFVANTLKDYAPKIVDHIDEWWIPVHKFQYELFEKRYREKGQLDDFLFGFKRDYDYLKSKGAI